MTREVPRFLSVADVLALHEDTIEHEGGMPGLRDPGLLESAVLMPQRQFGGGYLHPGLPEMAAAYLFHLVGNHAFHDGNKRTGALAALVFLAANHVSPLPDPEALEKATLAAASGRWTKDELTRWMRSVVSAAGP